jgi:hypothetical protein
MKNIKKLEVNWQRINNRNIQWYLKQIKEK